MATILKTTVPSKRLAASITAASTSIQVSDILGWDGVALTSSDFGSVLYAVLRNDSNTVMELMELDPATIASASITITRRGLKFTGDLTTEVTANKLTWVKNATIVELGSDTPQLLNSLVDLYGAQTITGIKTFSAVPASTAAPVAGSDLANKTYVDGATTGTTTVDKLIVSATAGETVSTGNLLYFDLTDNEWKKTDADTAASVQNVMLGIAQGAGVNGGAISGGVLLKGIDTNQSGMTQGDLQYASNTAGGISSSTGTTEKVIGIARSATNLFFDPEFYYVVTAVQKATLVSSTSLFTYGETITAGDAVYFKSSDQKVYKTDADAAATTYTFLGFAGESGVLNDSKRVQLSGLVTGLTGLTAGTAYYLSGTAAALSSTVGSFGYQVGVAVSTTSLIMNPKPSGAIPNILTYTSNDTWTKRDGLKYIEVELVGGGASGGGSDSSANTGGGGAGGGYSRKKIAASALGATETVTIGAGGTVVTGANDGVAGGTTSFGTHLQATGGGAGKAGTADNVGPNGGVGSLGDLNLPGQPGTPSALAVSTTTTINAGGGSFFGSGGRSAVNDAAGADGTGYGSGGSGAKNTGVNSGAGIAGLCLVKEFY